MQLRAKQGRYARALELVLLTAARSGEIRGAQWKDVDWTAKTLTIPLANMKTGHLEGVGPHVIPLSDRAIEILETLKAMEFRSRFIFVGRYNVQNPISHAAMLQFLRQDMKIAEITIHGLRSTFRDWASEVARAPRDVAEFALGHAVRGTEGSYRRETHLEQRRELMALWAAYCASPPTDEALNVIPFPESPFARAS